MSYQLPSIGEGWFTYDEMVRHIRDLDMTSTPGYPYMREKPTIGQWLGWNPATLEADPRQLQRLWYDVQRVLSGDFEHQFRVFVKDEPHKKAKADQDRWRLIMCAALPNQMVWRMCLKHQNDWLNAHPFDCPSSHGLVFCYGGWRRFKAHAASKRLIYSRDISSWDVNAPGWVFDVVKEFRQRAGGPTSWLRALDLLYEDAFEKAKLRFSNGVILQQQYRGTMKSGLYITIADNSLAMVAMHVLASIRSGQRIGSVWATGDDVLQSYMSDSYIDCLEGLGCKVKESECRLAFMGTDFTKEPIPMYLEKHIVNFWSTDENTAERLDAYARLWCFDDTWYGFWRRLAELSGCTLKSQRFYQFWYNSPWARMILRQKEFVQ